MLQLASVEVGQTAFDTIDAACTSIEKDLNDAITVGMQGARRAMVEALYRVYTQLRARHGQQWPTGPAPWGTAPASQQRMSMRSGAGLASIYQSIKVQHDTPFDLVTGRISTAKLTVHETGTTIFPKRSKYLTIPFMTALDSRGLPRKPRARDWDNTFISRSHRGNLIIFQKRGNRIVPLYLLARKAKIPARLGMDREVQSVIPYFMMRSFDALAQALET